MNNSEIFKDITNSFEHKHSWLGRQVCEEFLLSLASWNIQHWQKPDFRVATHKLFYWDRGWIKSSLLDMLYKLLDDRLAIRIADITRPAFRGSINTDGETTDFIPPLPVLYFFIFIKELGSITSKKDDLVQEMLEQMESGEGSTRLVKFSRLSKEAKKEIEAKWPWIKFKDNATLTFKSDNVYIAATYKANYITDEAFAERFEVILPEKPLTSELTKWSDRHGFILNPDTVASLNQRIVMQGRIISEPNLPDDLYDKERFLSHRGARNIRAFLMARDWWGLSTDNTLVYDRYTKMKLGQKRITMYEADKVAEALRQHGKSTLEELSTELNMPISRIRKALITDLDARRVIENGSEYYSI